MAQLDFGLDLSTKRTCKREFLEEMRRAVQWSQLIALIEPHYPTGKTGRPPFPIATMLQIHLMQQWFGLSEPAMEEALCDLPLYRDYAGLDDGMTRLPDESTTRRFCHLLEAHGLAVQMLALVNRIHSSSESWHPRQGRASIPRAQATAHVRYRGLMESAAQITTLSALGKLWMARKALRDA